MSHFPKAGVVSRRNLLKGLASAVGLACLGMATQAAHAEDYPSKPIRMVVPFAPGGPTDAIARHLATKMSELLGKSVVVDNHGGAGGTIGAQVVATAPADGYTLMFHEVTATFAIQPVITKSLPYDVRKDFTPIALAAQGPIFLMVNSTVPARNIKELVEMAKKNPGKMTFASAGGIGQFPTHMSPEVLQYKYGLKLNHVPYKGTGPAVVDVSSGRVDMIMTTGLGSVQPFLDSGKMKVLGVVAPKRSDSAPDVPTFAEQGYPLPELDNGTTWGVFGPKGLPKNIVQKLNEAVVKAMSSPEMREKLAPLTLYPRTSTPEELAKQIKSETDTWDRLLKIMKIQLD